MRTARDLVTPCCSNENIGQLHWHVLWCLECLTFIGFSDTCREGTRRSFVALFFRHTRTLVGFFAGSGATIVGVFKSTSHTHTPFVGVSRWWQGFAPLYRLIILIHLQNVIFLLQNLGTISYLSSY